MRVAQIIDTLKVGGAQSLLVTLAETVPPPALELDILVLDHIRPNGITERLRDAGTHLIPLPGRRLTDPIRFIQLSRRLREQPYDVMHTHLTYANILGAPAGALTRRPHVATLHNVRPSHHGRLPRLLERLALGRAAAVIAVGHKVADAYAARRPAPDVQVIPNAVAPPTPRSSAARRALRARLVGDPRRPLLIAVGRLAPQKGYPHLLAAMDQVVERVPAAALVIAGDGGGRPDLEAEIAARALADHVYLLGVRDNIPDLLDAADLFVTASLWEGLPVALLEALAAGLPVVATAVGEIPAVIDDTCGVLVPPGQPTALAAAILELLDDEARAARLGAAGTAHVAERYGAAGWARHYMALYARLASASSSPAGEKS